MSLQYLLDEHIPRALQREIVRREPTITVWNMGDIGAPPLGTLDPEILVWCENTHFVLVTNNRHSMPAHLMDHIANGHHIPGIFTINLDRRLRVIAEELVLIALASFETDHTDQIKYIPLT